MFSPARCTTASQPASASAGAGPESGSHTTAPSPEERDSVTTSSPRSRRTATTRRPISPVAPVTATFTNASVIRLTRHLATCYDISRYDRKELNDVRLHDGTRWAPLGAPRTRTRPRTVDVQDGPRRPAPAPRRCPRRHPCAARRPADARLRDDPGARGAQRGHVAAECRLDLSDAPAARGRRADRGRGARGQAPLHPHGRRPRGGRQAARRPPAAVGAGGRRPPPGALRVDQALHARRRPDRPRGLARPGRAREGHPRRRAQEALRDPCRSWGLTHGESPRTQPAASGLRQATASCEAVSCSAKPGTSSASPTPVALALAATAWATATATSRLNADGMM